MNKKIFLKILLFSILLDISLAPLRGYTEIGYCSTAGFIFYFFLTIICLRKYTNKLSVRKILLALITGKYLLGSPVIITYFLGDQLWALPDFLLHTFGIICGFLYWRLKKPFNILTAVLGCLITVFMFYQGWDYWLHRLNFGTFTGKVEASALPTKFEAFDEQRNLIVDEDFNSKIVLLDFWNTRCGVCFKKFSQVQAAYEKYQSDSSVMILAVDKPIEEDKPNQAFQMIKEKGYSFPVVITKEEDLAEKFGVNVYPTTFVINQNKQIVYKGDIEGAVKMLEQIKLNSR